MQTFLPLPDFRQSMACLDPSRLGNQVYREGLTLLRGGWPNHPACKMWRNHKPALALYLWCGLEELAKRGRHYDHHRAELLQHFTPGVGVDAPPWLGDPAFHAAHRSNLLRKNPVWYGKFGWTEPHDLEYIWPTT